MHPHISSNVARWCEERIELLPPIPIAEINTAFSRAPLELFQQLQTLFTLCGGMLDGHEDSKMFHLFPFAKTKVLAGVPDDMAVCFGEGLVASHAYGWVDRSDPRIWVLYDRPHEPVAADLEHFFELLHAKPSALLMPFE
jgi:hypothetical protein